jgi:multiple sugar transport system permease protein
MGRTLSVRKQTVSQKVTLNIRRVLIYIVLLLLTLLCIFPIWSVVVNMSRAHGDISTSIGLWFGNQFVENWNNVFARTNIKVGRALLNSFVVAFASAALCTYFSCLTAYGIQVYNFKGKSVIFTFILLIMMIPTQVSAVGFVKMMQSMGATDTLWPLIVPSIASPVVFFYMKQYMEANLPMEMIEAARVDGASEIRVFHQMILPIMVPAIAVEFIFTFVGSWNNLFIPSLLLTKNVNMQTIPVVISKFNDDSNPMSFDLGQVYIVLGLAILPLVAVYLVFSRFIISGMTAGSVKG